jgi:hypothetical protein
MEIKPRNKVFVTFGGSTENYHNRVNNLCSQVYATRFFTNIVGITDHHLKNDRTFWEKHGDFIESNPRGYGFWIWKPYIINKTLNQLNNNDILIYADAGCNINFSTLASIERMNQYIEMVDNSTYGILSFQLEHKEYIYTKKTTLNTINNNPYDCNTGQCIATVIIMRKTEHTIHLMDEWLKYAENYNLINDMKTLEEHPEFKDHRHDQSIFSLLVKKRGSVKIPDETFFHPNWLKDGANYPIWATRQRY